MLLLAFVAFVPALNGLGKKQSETAASIYRTFVGVWQGESFANVDGKIERHPVRVVISEEPDKSRMRLDYVYTRDRGEEKRIRYIHLDPGRESMQMQDVGDSKDKYRTSGLREFASEGTGDFSGVMDTDSDSGKERVTFHLQADKLVYEWAESTDGKNFRTMSVFSFTRK